MQTVCSKMLLRMNQVETRKGVNGESFENHCDRILPGCIYT